MFNWKKNQYSTVQLPSQNRILSHKYYNNNASDNMHLLTQNGHHYKPRKNNAHFKSYNGIRQCTWTRPLLLTSDTPIIHWIQVVLVQNIV